MTNDPTDYEVLTPAHFLIGESLLDLPEHDLRDVPINRLDRWQTIQQIMQHFWKRFHKEVVMQMQQRPKWQQASSQTLKPGMLVPISDESPPLTWKMGRVEELIPGPDGLPRVATIRTTQGIYKRSVRHLAVLPIDEDDIKCK